MRPKPGQYFAAPVNYRKVNRLRRWLAGRARALAYMLNPYYDPNEGWTSLGYIDEDDEFDPTGGPR